MNKYEQTAQAVHGFLSQNRYEPPARDGWFNAYEIIQGIKGALDFKVRASHMSEAFDILTTAQPPRIEVTSMTRQDDGNPNLEQQHQEPERPSGAIMFYRAVYASADYRFGS